MIMIGNVIIIEIDYKIGKIFRYITACCHRQLKENFTITIFLSLTLSRRRYNAENKIIIFLQLDTMNNFS